MGKPLSLDLRSRLVAAVSGGMSRRAAAGSFGVSAARAVRWVHASNASGAICARSQGVDRRSRHVEAFSDDIPAAISLRCNVGFLETSSSAPVSGMGANRPYA
jgi:hypothetical protein